MFNNLKLNDYNCDGYLDGLEAVKEVYKTLFNKYKDRKDIVSFVDPPYLSTEAGTNKSYWKLSSYLNVLSVIKDVSYF